MADVILFRPRFAAPAALVVLPPSPSDIRGQIEEAVQVALDIADRLIAVLDRMEGDTEREDGGDAEPSLAAPENHHSAQITWLRGNDQDREADAPEMPVPDAIRWPFPWSSAGNVLSATGLAVFDLVAGC
ncbi:hypothetical protein [Methylobacterium trifolii]|uniref:Uncharacterized protein n=1 Tax=Methylobacterium trifolii TaxID=1003092 RepID=A0ABQ4TX88_9HYPH|nr:hypothetical protein [Methylobacterium trifolii]GJE59119.1 hypothetical protein MPOCJGCO_1206 [Methylobacterium trifolii]